MAQIKIAGSAMVIESRATLEQLKKLERFAPDALVLKDKDGKTAFKVGTSETGSANLFGVYFGSSQPSGKATVTMQLPDNVADVTKYVTEEFGGIILNLNKVEDGFEAANAAVAADAAAVAACVTIL